jgi:hypothetical protein
MQKLFLSASLFIILLTACNSGAGDGGKKTAIAKPFDTASFIYSDFSDDTLSPVEAEIVRKQFRKDSINSLELKGYSVKRVAGKDFKGAKITVGYRSLWMEMDADRERAKKRMWSKETLDLQLQTDRDLSRGGIINLETGQARLERFVIVVKDTAEKKLTSHQFGKYNKGYSKHSGDMSINQFLPMPFFIYIVDEGDDEAEPMKFKVTPMQEQ